MFSRLDEVERRFEELEMKLSDPELANKPQEFRALSKERSSIMELVETFREYKKIIKDLNENRELLEEKDIEIRQMAKEEVDRLTPIKITFEEKMKILLLPRDPNDDKNILLEIRAGAGGDESALFAGELFRAYQKYADTQGWAVELLSTNPIGIGGFKEIIAMITGNKVFSKLKYEAGVHRVQRVPKTEAQGRVHTSTVTVAIMPEAEEVEVNIKPGDLRIDVFRAGGHGGQSVNTTDSAVRITHLPTNTVVVCQDEKSQLKNKNKAMKVLLARLYEVERQRVDSENAEARRSQVGTGDRSERIRTYNFPQSRLTDHRIGLTLHNLPDVMEGKLGDIVDALVAHHQAELLKQTTRGAVET
jgi:peptide chain release factor 1